MKKMNSPCINKILCAITIIFILLVSGCQKNDNQYQGYIDARMAFIASPTPGVLRQLYVSRGEKVNAKEALFALGGSQPQKAMANQAQAALDSAQSQRRVAQNNVNYQKEVLSRNEAAAQRGMVTPDALAAARAQYKGAVDALAAADAQIKAARVNVDNTSSSKDQQKVSAEKAGTVFDTYFLPSEFVPAGYPVVSLIYPGELRAVFFVREPQLSSIKEGQQISVTCDGNANPAQAKITFISPRAELTPPVLYSQETDRSKFVYRVEAQPVSNTDLSCFHSGQPVTVTLNMSSK